MAQPHRTQHSLWQNKYLNNLLLILILLVYGLGLFVEVMEVDAAQYASISLEMLAGGHWLEVKHRFNDYLDKPPLLFWLSALSFKVFGVYTWAYKLPSVIFSFVGFYSVYRLGRLLYSKEAGVLAALILATSVAWILFNNDVRTDTLLASAVALALWLLQEYRVHRRWIHLIAGFTAIAMAMLAKGPIGLMVPALALGGDMLLKRDWKSMFDWRWLAGMVITFLLLLPMLWGLYQQYDLHPEKIINGVKGESGIKFYFWTQSFGRITGQNVWHNDDSPSLFFFHTFLWSFAPWSVLFVPAIINKVKRIFSTRNWRTEEFMTLTGFLIPLIVLSFSHYKLPHYIFVIYPLASLLLADYLLKTKPEANRTLVVIQGILLLLVWLAIGAVPLFVFQSNAVGMLLALIAIFIITLAVWIKLGQLHRIVFGTALTALAAGFTMNGLFYPELLKYQSADRAAGYIKNHQIPTDELITMGVGSHALDFYSGTIVPGLGSTDKLDSVLAVKKNIWLFTNEDGRKGLADKGFQQPETISFPDYSVSLLSLKFLNPATREDCLRKKYLIHLRGRKF